MRILTFNYEYPPLGGGGGVAHELIAEELARSHDVTVVTSRKGDLPPLEERRGVEIRRVPVARRDSEQVASLLSLLTYPPSALRDTWAHLRSRRWDVVNGHFAVPTGPASGIAARMLEVPHVLSVHGGDIYDPSKALSPHRSSVLRAVVGAVLRDADVVVAQSTDTRKNIFRYYSYDGEVEIIPLGIREPDFDEASRRELGLPEEEILLVTVGRLVRRKGVDSLIRVVADMDDLGPHLAVVGEGPLLDDLRHLSGRLNVRDRVHFLGFVPEETKWQVLACSDLYVSATMHEGFGLVYLEAMLTGLPVVSFAHGGQVDFLTDGETGALLEPGDRSGLADAVRSLASDPERRRTIGRRNRVQAREYTAERCGEEYERLFLKLTDRDREVTRAGGT